MKSGFVSLIGRPNAGKSTLLNRLVGTKLAIVSDKPQTTRTRILGVKNYPDAQVVFLDTPGIHRPLHRMNVRMVDTAVDTIREVDVLGLVVDVTEPPGKGDRFVIDLVKHAASPVFLILNKIDLIKKSKLLPIMQQYSELGTFAEIVPVSAGTGDNVDRLERAIIDRLPEGEPLYPPDYLTDQPERFFAAEIVREKLLQFTHAELPFSTAVVIDRFEEPEEPKGLIEAVLHDRRRSRVAEADHRRPRRRNDQADRHRGARGSGEVLRHARLSRPARPREVGVAGGRQRAQRHRA